MHAAEVLDHKADLMVRLADPESPASRAWIGQTEMDWRASWPGHGQAPEDEIKSNAYSIIGRLAESLPDAECYHVKDEMTRLVEYAATQFDGSDRWDHGLIPTQTGIVRFDGGIPFHDVRGNLMRVNWVVWYPVLGGKKGDEPSEYTSMCMWNDHVTDPDDIAWQLEADAVQRGDEWVEFYHRAFGRWGFIGGEMMKDGEVIGEQWREPDEAKRAEVFADGDSPQAYTNPMRFMHAFFLLLGQTVADTGEAPLPKHFRKRAERRGIPARVTVVQLRHKATHRAEGESLVQWSHRWVVRGYWNWYHCGPNHPLAQQVAPGEYMCRRWIAPHVRGPEDKPLVVTEKVYGLHR